MFRWHAANAANSTGSCNGAQPTATEYWIESRIAGSDEISVQNLNIPFSCTKVESKHNLRQLKIFLS